MKKGVIRIRGIACMVVVLCLLPPLMESGEAPSGIRSFSEGCLQCGLLHSARVPALPLGKLSPIQRRILSAIETQAVDFPQRPSVCRLHPAGRTDKADDFIDHIFVPQYAVVSQSLCFDQSRFRPHTVNHVALTVVDRSVGFVVDQ